MKKIITPRNFIANCDIMRKGGKHTADRMSYRNKHARKQAKQSLKKSDW